MARDGSKVTKLRRPQMHWYGTKESVVNDLKAAIRQVKRGEVVAVALVKCKKGGSTSTSWNIVRGNETYHSMIAGSVILTDRLLQVGRDEDA